MDTWYKYKNKKFKINLNEVNLSECICYGNMLLHQLVWKITQHKKPRALIDKFFNNASIVLQATIAQTALNSSNTNVYEYIDSATKELMTNSNSAEDYALMLGNLSEFDDMKYTFVELVSFVRAMAAKI